MTAHGKLVEMKFIVRHKLLFCCLLLAWIIGMICTLMVMSKSSTKVPYSQTPLPLLHPLQHNRLPAPYSFKMAKALRYCNPPSEINVIHEGRPPGNYTLMFVAVVIRHGDRSPLRPVRNQTVINCGMGKKPLLLKKYLSVIKSIKKRSKKRYPFTAFPLYPHERICSTAQMTIVGLAQHLQLGHLLNKVYNNKHGLLSQDWSAEDMKVYSTIYSRTYQSAVAFLFGFLPEFDLNRFRITPSNDVSFCMNDEYCYCPFADFLQFLMDKKTQRLIDSHPAVTHLIHRLNPVVKYHVNHSDITTPLAMFDVVMGYVCHNSHLPCIPGTHNCVTIDQVRNVIAFLEWQGRQFVEDSTHKRHSWLIMQGFLTDLVQRMQDVISGKKMERFVLYSGHDTTITPLAAALGFDDGITPPYASRVIFELYSSDHADVKHRYAIKILYNGKDMTKYTPFCKMLLKSNISKSSFRNVCPFENFVRFVNEDFFARMNATSYSMACNISHVDMEAYEARYDAVRRVVHY